MFFFVRWVIYANTTYILQTKYFWEFVKTWNLVKAVKSYHTHTQPPPPSPYRFLGYGLVQGYWSPSPPTPP